MTNGTIQPAIARLIASRWHGGQGSALLTFATTGTIEYTLCDEIAAEANAAESYDDRRELAHLVWFIGQQDLDADGERGPVEGWHEATRWDFGDQEPLPYEPADA